MKNLLASAIGLAAAASASVAHAVEITGGSVELSYSAFTEETDANKTSLTGSVEVGFNRNISAQVDAGTDSFGFTDLDSVSFGVHRIYHMSDETSFGAFYTLEEAELGGVKDDGDIFGVEFGHEVGLTEFEGYLGRGESSGLSGTMLGLSGRYAMANGVGITGAIDYLDVEGIEARKLTVRLDGDVSQNLNMFVEVGTGKVSGFGVSESDPFVGIGGKITFGADRGATFERRSLVDLLPGG